MNPPFRLVEPDRLQIREGGGCMSVFGLPFFGAGLFLFLSLLGIVPVSNADDLPALAWPLLMLMAIAFTAVGGVLVFGRSWTTIDRAQREVIKQLGLLIPLHHRTMPLDGCIAVRLDFVEGDSDTADRFPIALRSNIGPDLSLVSFTAYAQARECARAVAEHLRLEIEDTSTDHATRLSPAEIDLPLQRRSHGGGMPADATRPPDARSRVTQDAGTVTIVIPVHPVHGLVNAAGVVPIAIGLSFGPSLARFFRQSSTPDPVAWVFLGFLALFFVVLPAMSIVNWFVRSRRGGTIVEVSSQGLRIRERGAWRTRTVASHDAADILDVDFSSRESSAATARRAAEQQALESFPTASQVTSPRVERMVATLTRFARGKGVTVKTRSGLTTFGRGLDDAETRYLYAVVRRALLQ